MLQSRNKQYEKMSDSYVSSIISAAKDESDLHLFNASTFSTPIRVANTKQAGLERTHQHQIRVELEEIIDSLDRLSETIDIEKEFIFKKLPKNGRILCRMIQQETDKESSK